jgi:uroporphyrinogen decarboxylase
MSAPNGMTSAERSGTTLGHQEPDRVPFLLPTILQGARELGLPIREYFSRAEYVVEGQLRLRQRYRHDALFGFMYASQELEAWGGETLFREDGPPTGGAPVIRTPEQIERLAPPAVADCPALRRVLAVIEQLRARVGDEAPIMGVAIAPFSLPVMQMGFEAYLDLMHDRPELLDRLLRVNEAFCVEWSNTQLAAGATAISYTDPVSSPTIVPRALSARHGFPVARRVLAALEGPAAIGLASGRCLPIVDDVAATGAVGMSASCDEDLATVKAACKGRLTVMGNLNAIEMRHWTAAEAESKVREAIAAAGPGGGFVLTDNHGEIPWQVPDEVLLAISAAVERWGRYPLDWI